MSYITILAVISGLTLLATKGSKVHYLDDRSKTNSSVINSTYIPQSFDELLSFIKSNKIQICVFGNMYSLGGHSLLKNGICMTTLQLNNILKLDKSRKTITVQPGCTWSQIINHINKYGLTLSFAPLHSSHTVGGSVSLNLLGLNGTIYKSVLELKIVCSNGMQYLCSRIHNSKLFSLVIGGFGVFGVIYEITLQLSTNTSLTLTDYNLTTDSYITHITSQSVQYRTSFLNTSTFDYITIHDCTNDMKACISKLETNNSDISQHMFNNIDCKITNFCTNDLLYYVNDIDTKDNITFIHQIFAIPMYNFQEWIAGLKNIFSKHNDEHCILQNILICRTDPDESYLKYVNKSSLSFVLYYKVVNNSIGESLVKKLHMQLYDACILLEGNIHLSTKCHYTKKQLTSTYPNIDTFVKYKKQIDKSNIFSNNWYEYIISSSKL